MHEEFDIQISLPHDPSQADPLLQPEILIAFLGELPFYAFEEKEDRVLAYIKPQDFREADLQAVLAQAFPGRDMRYERNDITKVDWNAEWEKNFEAVLVNDFCEIRPPFRESAGKSTHDLLVMPKMAFGTGHHATTWLMVAKCEGLDFRGKKVLDMGCGTGVLGILAHKLGAAEVTLIDIDPWSTRNSTENAALNGVEGLQILEGDANAIPADGCYDIILANINRNVLEADRDHFTRHLQRGGELVLSGIYNFDEGKLTEHYLAGGMALVDRAERKEWVRLAFRHSSNSGKEICL